MKEIILINWIIYPALFIIFLIMTFKYNEKQMNEWFMFFAICCYALLIFETVLFLFFKL